MVGVFWMVLSQHGTAVFSADSISPNVLTPMLRAFRLILDPNHGPFTFFHRPRDGASLIVLPVVLPHFRLSMLQHHSGGHWSALQQSPSPTYRGPDQASYHATTSVAAQKIPTPSCSAMRCYQPWPTGACAIPMDTRCPRLGGKVPRSSLAALSLAD